MPPVSKTRQDAFDRQSAEFKAADEFSQSLRNLPAIVDDDYPRQRHYYEGAAQRLAEAFLSNGRLEHSDFLADLHRKNVARQIEWGGADLSGLYKAVELGGEVGELLNVIKKWERERLGIKGSRASRDQGIKEFGDVLICLDLLAQKYSVDLAEATRYAFNMTSDQVGLKTRL